MHASTGRRPSRNGASRLGLKLGGVLALILWVVLTLLSLTVGDEPLPSAHGGCADVSPKCIDLVSHCRDPKTSALLRIACPVSCQSCIDPPPSAEEFPCTDGRKECPQLAASGRCDERPLLFWRDCPSSCRVCRPPAGQSPAPTATPPSSCSDSLPECVAWAAEGRCTTERSVMAVTCPESCGYCDRRGNGTGAHPTAEAPSLARLKAMGGGGGGGGGCADSRPECEERAAAGDCTAQSSRARMVVECARSCGTCQQRQAEAALSLRDAGRAGALGGGDARQPRCRDQRRACGYWLSIGECTRAKELMDVLCAATCGACMPSEAEQTPPRQMRVACGPELTDRHEDCGEWAAAGECEASPHTMRSACACACRQPRPAVAAAGRALPAPTAVCDDLHERCAGWALAGVCESTPVPMKRLCRRSCRLCGLREAAEGAAAALERGAAAPPGGRARASPTEDEDAAGSPSPQLHHSLARWCDRATRPRNASAAEGGASSLPARRTVRGVPLASVRLTPGSEFYEAQQLNADYLLSLSVGRLLWSFHRTAGLPTSGEPYGGWEASEHEGWPDPATPTRTLRGHFVGHYLSALAMGYGASGDRQLAVRAAAVVGELARCQRAGGSGFISAWPESVFDALEGGRFAEVWAPWYTVHKILAGLLDVHTHLDAAAYGPTEALEVAERYVGYLAGRVERLVAARGEEWWQATLEVEFGGIAEAAYRMHELSRDAPSGAAAAQRALGLARAFTKRVFMEPLAQGQDALRGRHANTHLPLLVSAARGAEVEGDRRMLSAPVNAYCLLQLGYAYAGSAGSSVNEHWPGGAASTGSAGRVTWAPDDLEDLVGGCVELAEAGECERAAPYMEAHCAASCAALELRRGRPAGAGLQTEQVTAADSDAFHTQESCTQYNALKLNLELFERGPDAALADAFERKLLNGVMGVQHPRHPGQMIYMMPLGAGVSKEKANWAGFGPPDGSFWCCYGTGVESFAKLADGVFFELAPLGGTPPAAPDAPPTPAAAGGQDAGALRPALWVSQFVPTLARWRAGGVLLHLWRDLKKGTCDAVQVVMSVADLPPPSAASSAASSAAPSANRPACFEADGCTIWIRIPSW